VDGRAPLRTDDQTWKEIEGYRMVMTFILQLAEADDVDIDLSRLKAMHFMMLQHDLTKSPGRWRTGPVHVVGPDGQTAYTGPEAAQAPGLMEELVDQLGRPSGQTMVDAAMAHLNLVMIHPFRDGNGRMARALQTMVLARDKVVEPTFASIEEWLGRSTDDYYAVLAATGRGSWSPTSETGWWVKFNLRAHHQQAQAHRRRLGEASLVYAELQTLQERSGLPERVIDVLYEAYLGSTVRRTWYVQQAAVETRTATRDLAGSVTHGLLEPVGATNGRSYRAGRPLIELAERIRSRRHPLTDPYPGFGRPWLSDPTPIKDG
jgi:Fic family protein